jgi:PAS domain S-box-containing protein
LTNHPPPTGSPPAALLTDRATRLKRAAVEALAISVAYYVGARIGIALTPTTQPVSTLWPPNAILLGALLLLPVRSWPLALAAAFPAHLAVELGSGIPLRMVLSWFVSNSAEAMIGAVGVRWLVKGPVLLDTFRRVAIFVVFALVAPFVSSFLDAAFVALNDWGTVGYWGVWRSRFFSNVLSILALVPVIVTWGNQGFTALRAMPPRRMLEASIITTSLLVVCVLAFAHPWAGTHASPVLLYAPLPFLLWAAVRFGPAGASGSLLIFALLSVWGVIHGQGPFVGRSLSDNVLSLQLFLILTHIPLMALTAVISERARAEEEARRNEQWLNLALGAAQVGAWDWDITSEHPTRAATSTEASGLGITNGGGSHAPQWLDAVAARDRPIVQQAIARAIAEQKPYEAEFRTIQPDGTIRWILGKGTVVRDSKGGATRMLGVNADITERKLAEKALRDESALRESEARFRALADATPQIVFTARPDGTIDYLNRKWYELTGTAPGEITEDTWLEILHPNDRAVARQGWLDNIRAGRPHESEARLWSAADGTYRWHLTRALPMYDATNAIVQWYGTATDIDDHKRAETALRKSEASLHVLRNELEFRVAARTLELSRTNKTLRDEIEVRERTENALRASEERFATAFRASLDAISIARRADATILEINDRWEALFGYTRDETIGRTVGDLAIYASKEDRHRLADLMRAGGTVSGLELDMCRRDGQRLRAVVAAESVEMAGEMCFIMTIRDLTEQRRAEHEIAAQRHELAHLGRVALLGELSGALAHELNQPLAAILANARAAQRMLMQDDADMTELRAILDDIVSDDRRAGAVIRRVRALIRKDDTAFQPMSVNEIIDDVLDLAHSDLIHRGVSVTTQLSDRVPPVLGDRVQMQQVLLNLIVNGCDAMVDVNPADRVLVVTTSMDDAGVCLSVRDNGTGISAEPLDVVFEPFMTSKEHGLGLGLAICRSILEAHGGRMWAVNNGERGATFHVSLPTAPVPAPEAPAPAMSDAHT